VNPSSPWLNELQADHRIGIVSIETEIKIKIEDPADFCRRLEILGPDILSARHFEDNLLLDFPDERLRTHQCLLRIRFTEGSHGILTFKGCPQPDGIFKTREELETSLGDGATALQILENIGMQVGFRYQKYRREYLIKGVHVAVDETPIGNYIEIEGAEAGIRNLAGTLGFEETQFVRLSYYSLYLEYCRERGETPHFMVFKDSGLFELNLKDQIQS
jgi:adenylate cyclase, class 2